MLAYPADGHPSRMFVGPPPEFDDYPVGKPVCARCGRELRASRKLDGTRYYCTEHVRYSNRESTRRNRMKQVVA